jgi:hypothetical protein
MVLHADYTEMEQKQCNISFEGSGSGEDVDLLGCNDMNFQGKPEDGSCMVL